MSTTDRGFGRYLTEDYRAKGRSAEADARRSDARAARDAEAAIRRAARQHTEPPTTRRLTHEGSLHGESGNGHGFGKHLSGDAPLGPSDAERREAESDTAGRGFGRYL